MFISEKTIKQAVLQIRGTANHLLKIWFVLKMMGMDEKTGVIVDTGNSTPAIKRLFSCGAPDGSFYIPFSHTPRFAFMKSDASRSIIQTTLQRWATSGSVVTCDPSSFLKIVNEGDKLEVRPGRQYPLGLGHGKNGFALEDNQRVSIPAIPFAVWLFCRQDIRDTSPENLIMEMQTLLHLTTAEYKNIFVDVPFDIEFQDEPISKENLYDICRHAFDTNPVIEEATESTNDYIRRVKNMITVSQNPTWIQTEPAEQLKYLIDNGERTILLYGPPRTGKTRAIDGIVPRKDPMRASIQLHEGWGYENLVVGLFPDKDSGKFEWKTGALLQAIKEGKKHIVLEEINRTNISQAMGELFSLIEAAYRGEENEILLPNGDTISIPEDTTIYLTMNTIDASTEDVDDALIGRVASVFFPPRVEDLDSMLVAKGIVAEEAEKIKEVFNVIQAHYPLGHGYFAALRKDADFRLYYLAHIRPVLSNHFDSYKPEVLLQIDNAVDSLF